MPANFTTVCRRKHPNQEKAVTRSGKMLKISGYGNKKGPDCWSLALPGAVARLPANDWAHADILKQFRLVVRFFFLFFHHPFKLGALAEIRELVTYGFPAHHFYKIIDLDL